MPEIKRNLLCSSVTALTAYLDQVAPAPSIGKLVKFSKIGEFLKGQDLDVIPDGTDAVAACDLAMRGFILWLDNRPAEQSSSCSRRASRYRSATSSAGWINGMAERQQRQAARPLAAGFIRAADAERRGRAVHVHHRISVGHQLDA